MEPRHVFRDVVQPDERSLDDAPDGRAYVAVVGIDRYRAWSPLHCAVNDARGVMRQFMKFGFEPIGEPLIDEAATGDRLRRLVTDDLVELGPDDSLILFFAGHGHTVTRTYAGDMQVKKGYIIPVDGDRVGGSAATWLRLDSWLSDVAHLRVRHLLVFLDSCHSGIALDPVIRWRGDEIGVGRAERPLGRLRARRSRRIITSALDDERAQDSGPIPGHSLFTSCLIEGLSGGLLASTSDVLVTGTEIGRYIQRRVINYPGSKQTPVFGALELDDRGELVVQLAVQPENNARFAGVAPVAPLRAPDLPSDEYAAEVHVEADDRDTLQMPSQDPSDAIEVYSPCIDSAPLAVGSGAGTPAGSSSGITEDGAVRAVPAGLSSPPRRASVVMTRPPVIVGGRNGGTIPKIRRKREEDNGIVGRGPASERSADELILAYLSEDADDT